jgi:hypothetical protein
MSGLGALCVGFASGTRKAVVGTCFRAGGCLCCADGLRYPRCFGFAVVHICQVASRGIWGWQFFLGASLCLCILGGALSRRDTPVGCLSIHFDARFARMGWLAVLGLRACLL